MDQTIQALFDRAAEGEHITLPAGEFEGPFHIPRRCTVTGQNTTLWAEQGPVLTVQAQGVVLRGLRADVTGNGGSGEGVAICSETGDTKAERVSVLGAVRGFGVEDSVALPKLIALGEFYADRTNECFLDVNFACETIVEPAVYDLRVEEDLIQPGKTRLKISTGIIRANTSIYGEITFIGAFIRRVFVCGCARTEPVGYQPGRIFSAPGAAEPPVQSVIPAPPQSNAPEAALYSAPAAPAAPFRSALPDLSSAQKLIQGQRVALGDHAEKMLEIRLYCTTHATLPEIDGFLFALQKNGRVRTDADLIFFNQTESADGTLRYLGGEHAALSVSLALLPNEIDRVAVAFAIYGDRIEETFGALHSVTLAIFADGAPIYQFDIEGLTTEKAMVGFECYRYQNSWKLSAVGSGYRGGMTALCESYGVEVDS